VKSLKLHYQFISGVKAAVLEVVLVCDTLSEVEHVRTCWLRAETLLGPIKSVVSFTFLTSRVPLEVKGHTEWLENLSGVLRVSCVEFPPAEAEYTVRFMSEKFLVVSLPAIIGQVQSKFERLLLDNGVPCSP